MPWAATRPAVSPPETCVYPTTLNHKYKPAYKVNVSSFDPYRYEIEDFLDLPEAPASLHAPMNKEAVE